MLYPENMQNYQGGEPELDGTKLIRRGLLDVGTDSGAGKVQPQMPSQEPAAQPSAIDNLLNMQRPMTPKEQSIAEHGKGGHIARSIGGFLLGDADMFTKDEYKDKYEADKARYGVVSNMKQNMPAFREYDAMMRDDDKGNDSEAMYMMNKMFGADDNLMKQMYGNYGGRNPDSVGNEATYTKGDYQRINGKWNLVQQANDGSIKYTEMGDDFTPSNRMMTPDALQSGLQDYQEKSFAANQNASQIGNVIDQMDELGEQDWGPGGIMGAAGEGWRKATGTENAVDMARKQYEGIKTRRAIQNLPPGVASDKDIELVMQEFPSRFTSYEQLRDYLVRLQRGEQKIQEYNNFSSRYLSNKGKRDGMPAAWDEHWKDLTSKGGKFYDEPKKKDSKTVNQPPPYLARPQEGAAGVPGGLEQSTEDILKEMGL